MLETLPISLLVGMVLGFLSGLGVGGGSLLMLWLTLVLDEDPSAARNVNLLFFIPCALVACFFRWKRGSLPVRKVLPAIAGGCTSAFLVSLFSQNIELSIIKKLFGVLLIFTGLREVLWKPKK